MDLSTRIVFTLLLYGALILGACCSLWLAQWLPRAARRLWSESADESANETALRRGGPKP